MTDSEPLIARIPADVDRPDKVVSGLTARQLLILTLTGGIAAVIYWTAGKLLPIVVLAATLLPLVAVGIAVALGRRDGLTLDRYGLAALLHWRSAKELVTAPEGVPVPPRWCRVRGRLPQPLKLPVRAIRTDGVLELTDGGVAVLVEASTLSFHLRTADEQAALVGAFGRWLNSLDAPVQILVRARRIDLSGQIDAVEGHAATLPHPALEEAAREHAAFLAQLNAARDLLTRQVLIVIRENSPTTGRRRAVRDAGAAVVLRRAAEAGRSLAALGLTAHVLDAEAAHQALAECLDPGGDIISETFAEPVTGREER
ncbi:PrgI family protein [Microtetraspora sp. AC03309]|uniref:PrgI family protein n=1 Tax=Microtetraspora sp. AC03309 TaxID=2779376 RepID=UPI001E2EF097|nr:PrgI family protein [Microtetraspora sp. AC03309]MCC5579235.1 PrgI family protein [Microtetraspora sp. AC03309]